MASERAHGDAVPPGRPDQSDGPPREIAAYTHFSFPGRKGKYSTFEWHWQHFDAVDYDELTKEQRPRLPVRGPQLRRLRGAGERQLLLPDGLRPGLPEPGGAPGGAATGASGTSTPPGRRLPAGRHQAHLGVVLPGVAGRRWKSYAGKELFVVGEYWSPDLDSLHWLPERGRTTAMSVFDVALHYNFHYASKAGGNYDMRRAAGRHADAAAADAGGDLRREPRLAAAAGPGVGGRAVVQAARLCRHPAAAGGLSLHLLRRLLRRRVRGRRPRRQPPPDRHAVAPSADRQSSCTPAGTTRTGRSTTTSITGTGSAGRGWATPSIRRRWRC